MSTQTTRRAVLAGAAAAVPASALAAVPASAAPDPIFAAIDRCIEVDAALVAHSQEDGGTYAGADIHYAANEAARVALAQTAPTTMAGMAALFGFLEMTASEWGVDYFSDEEVELFFATMADATARLAGKAVAA